MITQKQADVLAAANVLTAAANVLRQEFPNAGRRTAEHLDGYAEHLRREVSDQ